MTPVQESFTLKFPTHPNGEYSTFLKALENASVRSFSNSAQFNSFCRTAISTWQQLHPTPTTQAFEFPRVLTDLRSPTPSNIAIRCPWGGVLVKEINQEQTKIGKFLAVQGGKYLAFEWHYEKDETLAVREGLGLLIHRKGPDSTLSLTVMSPGVSVSLLPKEEHCLIALEDLLVYETSHDRRGMDKDLQFIFMPD